MENKNLKIQSLVLFLLILANVIAHVPSSLHLYDNPNTLLAQAKGISILLFVFVVFLLAAIFFFRRTVAGYCTDPPVRRRKSRGRIVLIQPPLWEISALG
ncbi:hypothetical protein [Dictyobacter alpinus]|uniref:hypothetical protein n=1 Tax=Dictyobacter alpinus TaxID=2014873 RepID=UPI000F825B72|nr:hypothetical protein [Dictyobacter alpinus]